MKPKESVQDELREPVWPPLAFTMREIMVQHKSLGRTMSNWMLRQVRNEVYGTVVDLASGGYPSYWRLMELEKLAQRIITIDLKLSCQPTIVADISSIPLKGRVADVAIIGVSLMYVPEPLKVLEEVHRILRPRGGLILFVPFVHRINPEPKDFWRFTPDGVSWALQRCHFSHVRITPIGDRWTTACSIIMDVLRPTWLFAPLIVPLCFWLDRLFNLLLKKVGKRLSAYPIGYVVQARAI